MAPIQESTLQEKADTKAKIRHKLELGTLLKKSEDSERDGLREAARMLRDEGISNVAIPFDAKEPSNADNRGTGQFVRFIRIFAFDQQHKRPILELNDGSKHILATYGDLEWAAKVWFDFDLAQEYKITPKHEVILRALSTVEPSDEYNDFSPTSARLSEDPTVKAVMSQSSVKRLLEDLFENGWVSRKQIKAAGSPNAYWIRSDLAQRLMIQRSASSGTSKHLDQISSKSKWSKYVGSNCPDSLTDSLYAFFTNQIIFNKENVKGIYIDGKLIRLGDGCFIRHYLSHFSPKLWSKYQKGSNDADHLAQTGLSQSELNNPETPADAESLAQTENELNELNPELKNFKDARNMSCGNRMEPKPKIVIEASLVDKLQSTFRNKNQKSLLVTDIIWYMSLKQKWMPPDKAKKLLRDAEQAGMIQITGLDTKRFATLAEGN